MMLALREGETESPRAPVARGSVRTSRTPAHVVALSYARDDRRGTPVTLPLGGVRGKGIPVGVTSDRKTRQTCARCKRVVKDQTRRRSLDGEGLLLARARTGSRTGQGRWGRSRRLPGRTPRKPLLCGSLRVTEQRSCATGGQDSFRSPRPARALLPRNAATEPSPGAGRTRCEPRPRTGRRGPDDPPVGELANECFRTRRSTSSTAFGIERCRPQYPLGLGAWCGAGIYKDGRV
jgi:hypothetical protein